MYKEKKSILSLLSFFAIILLLLVFEAPDFFSLKNFSDIMLGSATTIIGALGMMMVILMGQIDVSVGSIFAICCAVTGALAKSGMPVPLVVLTAVCVGAMLGTVNGTLFAVVGIDAIVVTLGTNSIYRGLLILCTQGAWITGLPPQILQIGQGKLLGAPVPVWISLLIFVLLMLVQRYTSWGRNLYAIGSNMRAAHLSGIKVKLTQVSAFAANGALVAVSAIIYTTRFGGVASNTGQGFEMVFISAAVVGGVSILGGSGSTFGTLLGAILIGTISTVLIFFKINSYWEQAVEGIIILSAVSLYQLRGDRLKALFARKGVNAVEKLHTKV